MVLGYTDWNDSLSICMPLVELSRSLLNLADRDGRASYPQFTRGGGTDHSGPLEKIDPEPSVARAFPPTVAAMTHAARSAGFGAPSAVRSPPSS